MCYIDSQITGISCDIFSYKGIAVLVGVYFVIKFYILNSNSGMHPLSVPGRYQLYLYIKGAVSSVGI